MRINKISVTNLFGIFNHEIPLNMGDRITIIHGPNGFGKTILLRMINGLFNSRYSELYDIPFAELQIDFDDVSYLRVEIIFKEESADTKNGLKFSFYQLESETGTFAKNMFCVYDDLLSQMAVPGIYELTQSLGVAHLIPKDSYKKSIEAYSKENFTRDKTHNLSKIDIKKDWFYELMQLINISFIKVQRLINIYDFERPTGELLVETYAEEIAEIIQDKLGEYATLSQSLDRTFPARVVQKAKSDLTEETLRDKLSEIENQRYELIEAGLLGNDDNAEFQVEGEIDEPTKRILSVYIEDVQRKLSVFEEIAKKIQLFQRIINNRFKYKKMAVSKDKGFTFTTHDGNPISPADLSSGEQHQLVLLYELLFKVEPNSLILIDEPELSLHLGWQVQFLKDLQEITKLGNFDVLLATHSPDIISDRWDLTVELKGPIA